MQYQRIDERYVIKLEKEEAVVKTLTAFCEAEAIDNAFFVGIGAVKDLTCGYYALEEKKYHFTTYENTVEAVSITGNVTLKEENPFIHVHGVFTNETNNAFGGHIQEMTVAVVLEIVLTTLPAKLSRTLDEEIGLFLFECDNLL